ncbi:hypothetical protein ACFE04_029074 [Oxalis oulophora]
MQDPYPIQIPRLPYSIQISLYLSFTCVKSTTPSTLFTLSLCSSTSSLLFSTSHLLSVQEIPHLLHLLSVQEIPHLLHLPFVQPPAHHYSPPPTRRRLRPLVAISAHSSITSKTNLFPHLHQNPTRSPSPSPPKSIFNESSPDHHRTHNKIHPPTAALIDQELVSVLDRVA